jgi:hypothetical protein
MGVTHHHLERPVPEQLCDSAQIHAGHHESTGKSMAVAMPGVPLDPGRFQCRREPAKHTPEQVANLLRQIEGAAANGKTTAQSCKEAEITEQTYYRRRKEYGGLQVDQARRLKELEQENVKLKRLVSELSLEKLVLKDIASGNF